MSENQSSSESSKETRGWEDLVFAAFDKLATASEKIRDPQGNVSAAVEWMKGKKVDWQRLSTAVGDHLAKNYEIEINAKVSFKPKSKGTAQPTDETPEA